MQESTNNSNNKAKRALILGFPIDLISLEDAVIFVKDAISNAKSLQIITINPEMIMQGLKNKDLNRVLKAADLIIPDGIGVVKVLKQIGVKNIKRLPGIELSQSIIELAVKNNYKIAFLGASQDVIEAMSSNLKQKYNNINIVYTHNGYFNDNDEKQIVCSLKEAQPDILFVALGVPRQETWIERNRKELNKTVMVGVGGSFDVWANKVKRAPLFFRNLGLEWFYRLITQPSRFNRMFPTIPLFFIKVMLDRKNTRKEY